MKLSEFIEIMLLQIKNGIDSANKQSGALQAGYPNEIEIDIALCKYGMEVCKGYGCDHPETRFKTKINQLLYPWLKNKEQTTTKSDRLEKLKEELKPWIAIQRQDKLSSRFSTLFKMVNELLEIIEEKE
jgi:hypothetical protein